MNTKTVNIAFQKDLLREIDSVAHEESRSRSEFLREAARIYIQRKRRWDAIFTLGNKVAKSKQLVPEDVANEIAAYRKKRAKCK